MMFATARVHAFRLAQVQAAHPASILASSSVLHAIKRRTAMHQAPRCSCDRSPRSYIIASGDTVATRWVVTGSQQQEFMGIPAAGQRIRVEGMNLWLDAATRRHSSLKVGEKTTERRAPAAPPRCREKPP
jgi:predicted ester cyclase